MLSIWVQQFQFVGFARTAVNQVKRADIRLRQATAASSQGRVIKCHSAQLFFGQTREHFNLRLINCMRKHGTKTAKTKWNEKKGKKTFFKICNRVTKGKCCVGFDAAFPAPGPSAPTLLQLPLLLLPSVVLPVFLLALKLIPLPQHLLLLLLRLLPVVLHQLFRLPFPLLLLSLLFLLLLLLFYCSSCCYCSFIRKGSISIKHKVFTFT